MKMNALIETKPCKTCGIEKPISDFYKYSETGTNRERYKGECKHCYKSKKRIKGIGAKIGGKMHYEVIDCFFEWLWESKRPAVSRPVQYISDAEIKNLINKNGGNRW
jgi:hypothetical protein